MVSASEYSIQSRGIPLSELEFAANFEKGGALGETLENIVQHLLTGAGARTDGFAKPGVTSAWHDKLGRDRARALSVKAPSAKNAVLPARPVKENMMSKGKAGLGALLACALCLCGFTAANASAANLHLHECASSGFTTVMTPFEDSNCTTTKVGGGFGWKVIPTGTSVTANVASPTTQTLATTVGGVKFKIECSGLNGGGSAKNEGEKIIGSGIVLHYTGCSAVEPTGGKCTVAAELTTNTLKSESIEGEMKIKYEPSAAGPLITIAVSGASCPEALKGNKEVTGSATALVEESGMGKIEEFTSTSSALKYAGQASTYTGTNGLKTAGGVVLGATTK
jgi:hypothetical protein